MSQDAIAGIWRGEATRDPAFPLQGTDDGNAHYLSDFYRGLLLDGEMASTFAITGSNGTAMLRIGQKPVCEVVRPTKPFFIDQLDWLRAYCDLRGERIGEINVQINDTMSFFGAIHLLNESRRKKTLELLYAVYRLTLRLEAMVKHLCRAPRPVDFSNQVQPVIQTPDHSSYPSGHATEAFAMATVLHRLMTGQTAAEGVATMAMPFRMAERIAVNRTVAGVHFPVDSAAGALLGCCIGDAIGALATGGIGAFAAAAPTGIMLDDSPQPASRTDLAKSDPKSAPLFFATSDFNLEWLAHALAARPVPEGAAKDAPPPVLGKLWSKAVEEAA